MPNILLLSQNDAFAADLAEQIQYYAKDYIILNKEDSEKADIIIVDEDTFVLNKIKHKGPLFFLSSDSENTSVRATKIISKPIKLSFLLDELKSCINIFENSKDGFLSFNKYVVRPISKDIVNKRNNEEIKLTEKEISILKYLYKNKDRLISKNELLQEVWGYSPDVSTHTIETHIYRLRQKVEHDDPEAQLILTADGGYQLKI